MIVLSLLFRVFFLHDLVRLFCQVLTHLFLKRKKEKKGIKPTNEKDLLGGFNFAYLSLYYYGINKKAPLVSCILMNYY